MIQNVCHDHSVFAIVGLGADQRVGSTQSAESPSWISPRINSFACMIQYMNAVLFLISQIISSPLLSLRQSQSNRVSEFCSAPFPSQSERLQIQLTNGIVHEANQHS